MPFIFVGEKPSQRALEIGATWQNGKLAGKTLKDALVAAGIDPADQWYLNLFNDDMTVNSHSSRYILARPSERTVVAMGQKVAKALAALGISHLAIVHPAARGRIRKTEHYQAHINDVLIRRSGHEY